VVAVALVPVLIPVLVVGRLRGIIAGVAVTG
jgi:hypothetical protein